MSVSWVEQRMVVRSGVRLEHMIGHMTCYGHTGSHDNKGRSYDMENGQEKKGENGGEAGFITI